MTVTIQRRVYLEPKYLDQNIMENILKTLTLDTFGECTKEYGHILSIERLIEIVGNEDCVFIVKFEATVLKPEAGKKMTGKVCMVYMDGIFINVAEKQKMLIPALSLTGYKFDPVKKAYVNGDIKIQEGDEIDTVVTAAKYSNKNFSCFGSLLKR